MRIIDNFCYGDIVLADFIFSDQQGGKLRPCMILYKKGEDFVVLKMTSQNISTPTILLKPDETNHLKAETYIDLHTIVTLQRNLFHKKLGCLDEDNQHKVKKYRSQFPQQR